MSDLPAQQNNHSENYPSPIAAELHAPISRLHNLRLAQLLTKDDAYEELISRAKGDIRTTTEALDITVEELAQQFAALLRPAMEDTVAITFVARHEQRYGKDNDMAYEIAGRLALSSLMDAVYFIDSFSDELPDDITSVLSEMPPTTLSGILEKNALQELLGNENPSHYRSELEPETSDIVFSDEQESPETDPEPRRAPDPSPTDAAGQDKTTQTSPDSATLEKGHEDGIDNEEASAQGVGQAEAKPPQANNLGVNGAEEGHENTGSEAEQEDGTPETIDKTKLKELTPEQVIEKCTIDPNFLDKIIVTFNGELVDLRQSRKYVLAIFMAHEDEWIKQNDYSNDDAMRTYASELGNHNPHSKFFTDERKYLENLFKDHRLKTVIVDNGKSTSAKEFMISNASEHISFYVSHEEANNDNDASKASKEVFDPDLFDKSVSELFPGELKDLATQIIALQNGWSRQELQDVLPGDTIKQLLSSMEQLKQVPGVTVDTGEKSSYLNITLNE